jgi:cyclopropane fatty-acyl-phospholipid synthase-like methyltransferase
MKNILNKFIIYSFLSILFLSGCTNDGANNSTKDTTNTSQSSKTATKVVDDNNSERTDWQRPDFVVSKMGNLSDKTVVDIGAGLGFFLVYLVPKAAKVIAADIDERAIQWLSHVKSRHPKEMQGKIDIRLVEPNDPNLAPNEVDAVLIVNTIAYIDNRVAYFKRLREAIKPNGIIEIVDFHMHELEIEAPPVSERLDPLILAQELNEAGFTIVESDLNSLKYQYIMIAIDPD